MRYDKLNLYRFRCRLKISFILSRANAWFGHNQAVFLDRAAAEFNGVDRSCRKLLSVLHNLRQRQLGLHSFRQAICAVQLDPKGKIQAYLLTDRCYYF